MGIFFTADMHLGHENIIKYCKRPFRNAEEMDGVLIANWNARVKDGDVVYVLGDMFKTEDPIEALSYLKKLNGSKILLRGNHEGYLDKEGFEKDVYERISEYLEVDLNGKKYVLCHYPILEWNGKGKGSICLHGHTHNTEKCKYMPRLVDVGVDANGFSPVSLKEIEELVKNG